MDQGDCRQAPGRRPDRPTSDERPDHGRARTTRLRGGASSVTGLTFGELDCDGALSSALERAGGDSRADFLCKALVGRAALLAGLTLPARAGATSKNDVDILNYALTLEYLQAAFYTETERANAVRGKAKQAARLVGAVERAHVQAFRKALGSAAVKRPTFDFRGVTEG